MTPLFRKLNFKDQSHICILAAPEAFRTEIEAMMPYTEIDTEIAKGSPYAFVLAFAEMKSDLTKRIDSVKDHLTEDAVLWFAYPKKSSKQYRSDITRDQGWQPLGDLGFEGVRQVAIDADWSALRFRQARHIKTLKRAPKWRMSEEGKKRAE